MSDMQIKYKYGKDFTPEQVKQLFTSVNWVWDADNAMTVVWGLEQSTQVISAWDGDKLVGLVRCLDDTFWSAVITCIAVHKDYQRKGIGKEMMRRLLVEIDGIDCISAAAFDEGTAEFFSKAGLTGNKQVKLMHMFG